MIRVRTIMGVLVSAAVFGLVVALPLGRHRQVSVELWLTAVAAWAALTLVVRVLATAPLEDPRLQPLLWRRTEPAEPPAKLPRDLLALDGTLLAARDSERAFAARLRPRLQALVDHRLRVDHGIDREREPARAAAVLGDVAWLVGDQGETDAVGGPGHGSRTPTLPEIDLLLDRLEGPTGMEKRSQEGPST